VPFSAQGSVCESVRSHLSPSFQSMSPFGLPMRLLPTEASRYDLDRAVHLTYSNKQHVEETT
jgi:hypothetical protein